ncbi:MAG TPA: multifunctional oxoglutarate decarboxylase/oxoglutarate dehydrogenase thiamine pyrophosphate-binding subunit/dihydrolipoyllysine-residue succinyltransferase subunit [Mycobacteriales bacterium]|nr:multifunctional oxoglutarate decarboxylase/oxoglutarate dehydrogenase thiamine pyrophosphate-binding subunit/dihydrolipoyllysine-residue succinyltransferase subunit [Mycobacteriales bacterium]
MSTQADASGFGMNEWLVQEKYQLYLADPTSVDQVWQEYFVDHVRPNGNGREAPQANGAVAAPVERPPAATIAPAAPVAPAAPPPAPSPAPVAAPTPAPTPKPPAPEPAKDAGSSPLRGAAARTVANMESSLHVPTATSVRAVPAKLLADNRTVINRHLTRGRGGKVSFTHLIGYALVQAARDVPVMNNSYAFAGGKPTVVTPSHVNLGLAIDLQKPDGSRSLVVACIRNADTLDFSTFWSAYEDIVRRARQNKLTADDFSGTTISLTNPGGIGTVHSIPRLMEGQGTIIGVGAMEYPAEFQGASAETLTDLGISRTITLTSTYDHRVIQGAQSGEFLRRMHQLLLGEDGFYDQVFASLRIPYEPVRWVADRRGGVEGELAPAARVAEMIHAYRVRGHLMADTDPLEFQARSHPDLDIVKHGLTLWDLDRTFPVGGFADKRSMPLRDVLGVLRDAYCRTVGVEYMHIQDPEQREWIQQQVEDKHDYLDNAGQLHVLEQLNAAEAFESFLQTKFVGQKRFSLEGAESTIPMLDEILTAAARAGLDEVVIGMPHRGRLNVLANIVGKSYAQIFREFEGNIDPGSVYGSGDVKYHLGTSGTYTARDGKKVTVSMTANPSHLEAVDPVLEGLVRAKQDLIDKGEAGFTVLPLLMHGDAAFAGQGVVAETLQMGQLRGYRTGGTIHLVVNNQVGFTTAPGSARSSVYCTDVARMVQAPIFHVNGDDPEACVRVARLAFAYRQRFRRDVVIDLVCYRRRGHQEIDEPSFTQPLMYRTIEGKRSVRKLYLEALIGRGDITREDADKVLRDYSTQLENVFKATRDAASDLDTEPMTVCLPPPMPTDVPTAVSAELLQQVARTQVEMPEGFTLHKKLAQQLAARAKTATDGGIDWAGAETFAFGSLLLEGHAIRLAGQDSRRGTFGQRHAVVIDQNTGAEHNPLRAMPGAAPFHVYDSLLSEYAAMGFEYGYALGRPEALVLWEAQFGDFANGAQSIVDEFLSSSEAKWGQRSGVVLLLPHGYEGQGPDHSSARVERFLVMCAEENMTVAMPSTPASYFHLLRRHVLGGAHRPLVVFTPKSMLRLKAAASAPADLTAGGFREVIPDASVTDPAQIRRVLLCTGKVYYDLAAARDKAERDDVAILRVEQLYPTPEDQIISLVEGFEKASDVVWVQEEPANQGPWGHVALALHARLGLRRVSRRAAASPATGSPSRSEAEQRALVAEALDS